MTDNFSYTTQFVLDKKYYRECFDESMLSDFSWRSYAKAIFFMAFGGVLVLFTHIEPYAAWFIFALGIVEALSVYYQKPWWVTRQMLSKESKSEVTLTINEHSISSHSFYTENVISWSDVTELTNTQKGWLVVHNKGKSYLSASVLSDDAINYLNEKSQSLTLVDNTSNG